MRETIFVWDSVNDCVISELDGSGAVQVSYTNEPQHYGGVISQRRGTTTSTYHADALGSTRALTDNSGNVTDTYLNDAWGNSVASTGTTVNPFRWIGEYGYYTDSSTGQVYVRARMYQPALARWCSLGPLKRSFGSNVFSYVYNAGMRNSDPYGMFIREPPDKHPVIPDPTTGELDPLIDNPKNTCSAAFGIIDVINLLPEPARPHARNVLLRGLAQYLSNAECGIVEIGFSTAVIITISGPYSLFGSQCEGAVPAFQLPTGNISQNIHVNCNYTADCPADPFDVNATQKLCCFHPPAGKEPIPPIYIESKAPVTVAIIPAKGKLGCFFRYEIGGDPKILADTPWMSFLIHPGYCCDGPCPQKGK